MTSSAQEMGVPVHGIGTDPLVGSNLCDDVPARVDELGFGPYVDAVTTFLLSDATKTPLTVSIEGEWGTGKTSFMTQLSDGEHVGKEHATVFFNAWRNDSAESLWAAFALQCVKDLRRHLGWWPRLLADARLSSKRFDMAASLPALLVAAFRLALVAALVWAAFHVKLDLGHASDPAGEAFKAVIAGGGALGVLAFAFSALKKIRDVVGDPFDVSLRKYIAAPDYRSRIAFVERFHEDFRNVFECYVRANDKVFIFIDDLDRCDAPLVAELVQAINLLTSSNVCGPIFVIGMDRKVVAAALAAKFDTTLKYLAGPGNDAALDYGYAFMDKFVQVPFRLPRASTTFAATLLALDRPDGRRVEGIIKRAVRLFDNNPRRLKQYVNLLRLTVHVLKQREQLADVNVAPGQTPALGELTVEKVGRFLAVVVRWPRIVEALGRDPALLAKLQCLALDGTQVAGDLFDAWKNEARLVEYLAGMATDEFPLRDYGDAGLRRIFSIELVDATMLLSTASPAPREWQHLLDPETTFERAAPASLAQARACGPLALTVDDQAWNRRCLELVFPHEHGGIAHYRGRHAAGITAWTGLTIFGDGVFDGAVLIQSSYNDGNLEAIARRGRTLHCYYHHSHDGRPWTHNAWLDFESDGDPVLLQTAERQDGNFHLVFPCPGGGLGHAVRNNALNRRPWNLIARFGGSQRLLPCAIFEEQLADARELVVFAWGDDDLYEVRRQGGEWSAPAALHTPATLRDGARGLPAFARAGAAGAERYVVLLPTSDGVSHWALRDAAAAPWERRAPFAAGRRVDAVAAVRRSDALEAAARAGTQAFTAGLADGGSWDVRPA